MGRCHITREPNAPTSAPLASGDHFVNTATNQTYLAVGNSTVSDWILINQQDQILTANLPDATPVDVDTIPMTSLCTVKYVVCVYSSAQNKWRSFEMLGGKKTSTTVENTLYSSLGSALDVDFDFEVSGTDATLTVTNNEAFAVDVKVHKNLI